MTPRELSQSIYIDGEWRSKGKGPHDDLEIRVAYSFLNLPEYSRWTTQVEVTAVWLTAEEGGWRVSLKGIRRGRPLRAFLHAPDYKAAVVLAGTSVDVGQVEWKHDPRPIS